MRKKSRYNYFMWTRAHACAPNAPIKYNSPPTGNNRRRIFFCGSLRYHVNKSEWFDIAKTERKRNIARRITARILMYG